ncbi:winged helix-turn-helix transcriptional regulator [Thermofilum pendens]|uniref:HTH hxlR-type domain-containing protein n=1 Tax=Thermofilum pendens (strain DSM 2475 / Hrk 5) TaxID=368408 RepID=A1RWD4_THEPD|nr:winged helix-turn-helix transcriptional regulator [Thermofilum pendens]ABL77514.1 hypothetical protein Tpen_0104 [Thermofilum pendens Hrk 5]
MVGKQSFDRKVIFTEADLILLSLLNGEKKISDLRQAASLSTTSIYNNINKLLEWGLIEDDRVGSPGNRIIRLTEKGLRVARILKMLEDELTPKVVELKPE